MDQGAAARHAMETIVAALRNVRCDPTRERPVVIGRSGGRGAGNDRIDLLVISDVRGRPDGNESDQYEQSFYLTECPGRPGLVLLSRKDHALDDHPQEGGVGTIVAEANDPRSRSRTTPAPNGATNGPTWRFAPRRAVRITLSTHAAKSERWKGHRRAGSSHHHRAFARQRTRRRPGGRPETARGSRPQSRAQPGRARRNETTPVSQRLFAVPRLSLQCQCGRGWWSADRGRVDLRALVDRPARAPGRRDELRDPPGHDHLEHPARSDDRALGRPGRRRDGHRDDHGRQALHSDRSRSVVRRPHRHAGHQADRRQVQRAPRRLFRCAAAQVRDRRRERQAERQQRPRANN